MIEEEAELAAEAAELTPGADEFAGDPCPVTIHHHLSRVEARRVLAVAPLTGLLVLPGPMVRGLADAPLEVLRASSAMR